ncbi:MAG: hypothetical protein ACLF0G_08125 [Candidatus Brocadiia bacterium]
MTRIATVLVALAAGARAAAIQPLGTLGNSGESGEGLVRVGRMPLQDCRSGVALGPAWTLWTSGGEAVNRIGLDGRLVERVPLEPRGFVVDSRTFAVLEGRLYFLGRHPKRGWRLFELPMRSGSAARPLAVELPPRRRGNVGYCLAPQPLDGRLVLAAEPEGAEEQVAVCFVEPAMGRVREAFRLQGSHPQGLAVDADRRVVYLGASFGLFVGGVTHPHVFAIAAVRPDGTKVSEAFPVRCMKTPALPTQFRGRVSLAAGAIWDAAWYGFLARFDLQGRGEPGRVVEWHHELDHPTQVLGLWDRRGRAPGSADPLLIATPMPDACYYALWDRAGRELRLVRRIGALPVISSLGLSQDGWVTASTARTQLWWKWDDPADAPPRKTDIHLALTPLVFQGERAFAIAAQYHLANLGRRPLKQTIFSRRPGGRNEARRVGRDVPLERPAGLAVGTQPGEPHADLFVTDAQSRKVWRKGFSMRNLQPRGEEWQPLDLAGVELAAPTDVAALTDGRLLLADAGRVLLLEPRGQAYRPAWVFERWGEGEAQRFGERIRFALSGPWMLVADTERHRLVWFDWTRRRVLAQLGTTDVAGDSPRRLDGPTLVALEGSRAVVADAGNQRILKLRLQP